MFGAPDMSTLWVEVRIPFSLLFTFQGMPGARGSTGSAGPRGPPGDAGRAGEPGPAGLRVSVWSSSPSTKM